MLLLIEEGPVFFFALKVWGSGGSSRPSMSEMHLVQVFNSLNAPTRKIVFWIRCLTTFTTIWRGKIGPWSEIRNRLKKQDETGGKMLRLRPPYTFWHGIAELAGDIFVLGDVCLSWWIRRKLSSLYLFSLLFYLTWSAMLWIAFSLFQMNRQSIRSFINEHRWQ